MNISIPPYAPSFPDWMRQVAAAFGKAKARFEQIVSVIDYDAQGNGVADDYAAIQSVIDDLPAGGGEVTVPSGNYKISAIPNVGAKSVHWNFAPDASFSGVGAADFPRAITNTASQPVGPYILSQSTQHAGDTNGAVNALTVEMIQPTGYGAGQSVGAYVGAQGGEANAGSNVWACNFLVRANAGALGTFYGNEIDVDTYAAGATTVGMLFSGTGDYNGTAAIIVDRLTQKWATGFNIRKAVDGIVIFGESGGRGVVIDAPSANVAAVSGPVSARQYANAGDTVFLQRFTDTSPTGYYLRFRNAADNADVLSVGAGGLGNFATDAAAAAGGVAINQLYRNGSVVQIRVT